MEEATVTLYRVKLCGFYDGSDQHCFTTLAEAMRSLLQWAGTLGSIGESSTYSVDEDADILRAFCIDIKDLGGGRYLLATWNELPKVEDGVQVLQVESRIGAASISAVQVDALSLPGYPAFFCVDTRRQRIVNLRFDQRLNGSRQLQRFIAGYLASASPWCVWDADDEEQLLGYSDDDSADPQVEDGLVARFETGLVRVSSDWDYIRDHCADIRKIVRRAVIDPEVASHKSFLDSAFEVAGLPINNRLKADINFQYEFKTRLTPAKLQSVIENYESNVASNWDDVGFIFAREGQKVHWLSGAIAREKFQLNVGRSDGGMIDIDSLAECMREQLTHIMDSFSE